MRSGHLNSLPILLIEDDADDVYFFGRALTKTGATNTLYTVRDGAEAIAFFSGSGKFEDRAQFPIPALVVLDLNLPLKHGLEVLKWMRENETTRTLIVVILTSSSAAIDIEEAYRLGANSYLVKPADPTDLTFVVSAIKDYWLGLNRPPDPATSRKI